jgi:hypothetical protein
MNGQQMKDWLGVGDDPRELHPAITEAVSTVPWPAGNTMAEHKEVFAAFLRAGFQVGDYIWAPQEGTDGDQASS